MRRLLLLIWCFLSFFYAATFAEDLTTVSLIWKGKSLSLDNPLLEKNGVVLMPLQDSLSLLEADLSYSRRDDTYVLKFKKGKTSLILSPGSDFFWINNVPKKLPVPAINSDGVFYFPLEVVLESLGYQITKQNEKILVSASNPVVKSPPSFYLVIGNNVHPVYDSLIVKGILYAGIDTLFPKLGFIVHDTGSSLILSKSGNKTTLFSSVYTPSKKRVFPLISTLSQLGFSCFQLSPTHYQILSQLTKLTYQENTLKRFFSIHSSLPITDSDIRSFAQGHLRVVDLPYTQTPHPILLEFANGPIQKALLASSSPTSSRLSLFVSPDLSISSPIKSSYGGYIQVLTDITEISESYQGKTAEILIKTTGLVRYSFSFFENPDRLVLDIPYAMTRIPSLTTAMKETAPYFRIRSSQFQFSPAITRIVFDLKDKATFRIGHHPKGLLVTFPLTPTPSSSVAKPSVKTSVVVKPKPKKPRLLSGKLIVIDPGHGGDDPGALAKDGSFEKDYTLDISKRLERLLVDSGAHVLMCRHGDQNPTLEERTRMANINNPDAFISVHINSFFSPFTGGTETYYYKYKDEALSKSVHQSLVNSLQLPDKGIKRARLYVLRNSTVPAVLVEPLFITNRQELSLLEQPYFRQKIADALFEGLKNYLLTNPAK